MGNWHDSRYTAHHHDHVRDYRKHEPRPGEPDFPIRLETAPITGALEVAILVQAIPLQSAADLIEQYAKTYAAGAVLDAVSKTIDKCCEAIEADVGHAISHDIAAEVV